MHASLIVADVGRRRMLLSSHPSEHVRLLGEGPEVHQAREALRLRERAAAERLVQAAHEKRVANSPRVRRCGTLCISMYKQRSVARLRVI